jgi:DNA (cytosine-5)-methyltransferase 1
MKKNDSDVLLNSKLKSTFNPKVISLFSGCGGLDLGIHLEGYGVDWANEFNRWAADTYELNFKGARVDRRSILDIDPYTENQIPNADLIVGGFPCQDFSIIWKRPGLDGSRGSLYKEFLRFVDAKKPKAFIAENVRGILSANGSKAIRQIISDFEAIEPGYTLSIKLYNFADYGVPQFRERVLIVGIRNDTGFDFQHPGPTHGPKANKAYFTAGEALVEVGHVVHNNEHMKIMPRTREILARIPEGGNFADIPKDDPLYVKGMISHVYRRVHLNEPAKTLIASGGGGTWGYHYPEHRALTNRERARLQSFPDWFVFSGSFGEIRRQIGNAVPPEGIRLLARNLKPLFSGQYKKIDLYEKNAELSKLSLKERILIDYHETVTNKKKGSLCKTK